VFKLPYYDGAHDGKRVELYHKRGYVLAVVHNPNPAGLRMTIEWEMPNVLRNEPEACADQAAIQSSFEEGGKA